MKPPTGLRRLRKSLFYHFHYSKFLSHNYTRLHSLQLALCTVSALAALQLHLFFCTSLYLSALRSTPPRPSSVHHSHQFLSKSQASPFYARHTLPWPKYPHLLSAVHQPLQLLPNRTAFRFLVSSASTQQTEDVLRATLHVAFERLLANRLNLTYVHRISRYGVLSMFDRYAVERFLGWTSSDTALLSRESFLSRVCQTREIGVRGLPCGGEYAVCRVLKRNRYVDRIVHIPVQVVMCLGKGDGECGRVFDSVMAKYSTPRTLFHIAPQLCESEMYVVRKEMVAEVFRQYWAAPRASQLDPRYVNVALYVPQISHGVERISDVTYARLVKKVISVISELEMNDMSVQMQPMSLNFRVLIFSVGRFYPRTYHPVIVNRIASGRLVGLADVNNYRTEYVSEQGVEMGEGYWGRLLGDHPRIQCELHISEDVLQSIEQMFAADVLILSDDRLDVNVATQVSRGVSFVTKGCADGLNCSKSIRWDPWESDERESYFDADKFKQVWGEYRRHIGADRTPFGIPLSDVTN